MSTRAKPLSDAKVNSAAAAYDALAPFYDAHWGFDFLEGALTMFERYLGARVAPPARLLDVCCGSGEFAGWASKRGYALTGVDLSEPMLALGRDKAPQVCFEQKDIRTFRLASRDFEAAVCFYNSLNQMMSARALQQAVSSVAAHVREGGWFLFDFIGEEAFARSWTFQETAVSAAGACRLRYRYNPRTRIATCAAQTAHGDRTVVRQRPIEAAEIEAALTRAGFRIEAIDPVTNVNPASGRSAVLARRGS